jgi:DNA-binding transcriptional MerR regulator
MSRAVDQVDEDQGTRSQSLMTVEKSNELSLNDRFQFEILVEKAPRIQPGSVGLRASSFNLPEALVDEELLRELASIPDRMGFKIGEVTELLGVKHYILRYWEKEFDLLRPKKSGNRQRCYSRQDIENAFLIRKLLHRDRFSVEGAKAALKGLKKVLKTKQAASVLLERLQFLEESFVALEKDLQRIKNLFQSEY